MKKLKHILEAVGLAFLVYTFRLLPLDIASMMGGFIARSIGPCVRAHKTADKNLKLVFPNMDFYERRSLLLKMWDNLGRVATEMPHLPGDKLHRRIAVIGAENIPAKPVIFFSGHLGNWELLSLVAHRLKIPTALIYRHANNPYTEQMIADIRVTQSAGLIAKGPHSAIKIIRAIKNKNSLAMLIDQKMNDGISVPFFGRDAMTAPAIAELALRFDMPIVPARVVRKNGAHFEVNIYPPLQIEKTNDREKDVLNIMTTINAMLESWIKEYPQQWFWVHKRWPES